VALIENGVGVATGTETSEANSSVIVESSLASRSRSTTVWSPARAVRRGEDV
jgi:hypothetical protein